MVSFTGLPRLCKTNPGIYCVIWSPHLKQHILTIEKVQRLFTKRLWKLNAVSYPERLHHLGIPSLEFRRLYFHLIYCYKIVFVLVRVKFEDFFSHHLLHHVLEDIVINFSNSTVAQLPVDIFSQKE